MASTSNYQQEKKAVTVTGEPTDQLSPEEDLENDLDGDTEDDEEPYEGIRHDEDEDEGMVDDNMTGMPVVPSPS
ncbi:MAG: hypothetical protein EOP42_03890 [Sphingobacteriaceae bacterium]|nr:MAG: hypothetical protein EOP42_03890 [Sphingobacteriaceae bacterium]